MLGREQAMRASTIIPADNGEVSTKFMTSGAMSDVFIVLFEILAHFLLVICKVILIHT